jgi:hypothetical protein
VNSDDARTLGLVKHFTRQLLDRADVLPADLAIMLGDFQSELGNSPSWRWAGIGDPIVYEYVANRMGQLITDGEWPDGQRLDSPHGNPRAWDWTPDNFRRALQLLTARGEIVMKDGGYYPRPP